MDCYQFLKHMSSPQPYFFSNANCSGTPWNHPLQGNSSSITFDFQLSTNPVFFNPNATPKTVTETTTIHALTSHFGIDVTRANAIQSFLIPQHYTVTITKAILPKPARTAFCYDTDNLQYGTLAAAENEIIFHFNIDNSYTIYDEELSTQSITFTSESSFNTGEHPFFNTEWLQYTYYYKRLNLDGSSSDISVFDNIEYHPNSTNHLLMDDPSVIQTNQSVEPTVYLRPPVRTYPLTSPTLSTYLWKIRKVKCISIIKSITITSHYTQDQFIYDSCVNHKPWYIGDFPFQPTISQCESFVTSLCQLHPQDKACTCLNEERDINNPLLPVICYGNKCLEQGFVFRRMKEQDCRVDICQQLIHVEGGPQIKISGAHSITCGHQVYTSQELETINKWASESQPQERAVNHFIQVTPSAEHGFCNWHLIVILGVLMLLFLWVPLLVVYTRKQEQIISMNHPQRRQS
jgi:hypothetical protein